jgi:two-component system response regulator DctR
LQYREVLPLLEIKVLVVDDDPMVLRINQQYVEAVEGYRVVGTARSPQQALEAVREQRPNLVLLDIYMPGGDGLAALKEIRRQEIAADVIMISAADDVQSIQDAMRYGAVDYIIKPFRFQRLQAALDAYRARKSELDGAPTLRQEQLDKFLRGQGRVAAAALPKGLTEATMHHVRALLAEAGEPLTATAVGERLGLARVTARRYLDYLVKAGSAGMETQYGSVGRPTIRYRSL